MEQLPQSVWELPEHYTPWKGVRATTLRGANEIAEQLSGDQPAAFKEVIAFIESERNYHIIDGWAGTGKTWLVNSIAEYYLGRYPKNELALTATTNKAVNAARDKSTFEHDNMMFSTTHKILGLKEDINDYGVRSFKPDWTKTVPIETKNLVFVDEVSQMNKELFELLRQAVGQFGFKIIFVGDFAQAPPVGERMCTLEDPEVRKKYKVGRSTLLKVLRQAEGNPIIRLATTVRNNLSHHVVPYNYQTELSDKGNIVWLPRLDTELVYKTMDHFFNSNAFRGNPDFMKVLAYTNDVVNAINHKIRLMLYKEQALEHRILPGEKLIAHEPIVDEYKNIIFTTNSEFEVLSYNIEPFFFTKANQTVYYYLTKVVCYQDPQPRTEFIRVLHHKYVPTFNKIVEDLRLNAEEHSGNPSMKWLWKEYYRVKETFAPINYNYALTTHKSQGSTFANAMVLEKNIEMIKTPQDKNRILYVAYTRPAVNLLLVR